MKHRLFTWFAVGMLAAALLFAEGCSKGTQAANAPEPLEVEVAPVLQRDVPIYSEWIGTLDGMVNADIKAQVSGYLLQQDYTEGSFVKKGQLLFEIDPRPFQAVVDQAEGQLAQATGQLAQAKAQLTQARSAGVGGRSQSSANPTGCGPLHSAGEAAGHHAAGSGQRHAEQSGGQGAGAGGQGASGNRASADSGRAAPPFRRPRLRWKPRN